MMGLQVLTRQIELISKNNNPSRPASQLQARVKSFSEMLELDSYYINIGGAPCSGYQGIKTIKYILNQIHSV